MGRKGKGQVKEHVYKGPRDKDKGVRWVGKGRAGESNRGKMETTVIEQQYKFFKKG